MKLIVEPKPEGYDLDKAVTMTTDDGIYIVMGCNHAHATARKIARRVNWFDQMIALLGTFGSNEMGSMLVDVVVANPPKGATIQQVAEVELRMRALVNAVDVILKGYELAREKESAEGEIGAIPMTDHSYIPKFYPIGPNTCGGYHSNGDGGEFAIPDYMHPELGPDHTPLGSPAKVTLWFKSWDEAKQFMAFIDQARIRAQCAPNAENGKLKELLARWWSIGLNGGYGAGTKDALRLHPIVGETAQALSSPESQS